MKNFLFAALVSCVSVGMVACSSDGDPVVDNNTNKVLEEIEVRAVDGESTTMKEGRSQKFNAIAKYADDTTKDVSSDPGTVWTSSDTANATVDKSGLVNAIDEGTVKISASYSGKTGTESLIITP